MDLDKNDENTEIIEDNYLLVIEPEQFNKGCQTEEVYNTFEECTFLFCNLVYRDGSCTATVQANIPRKPMDSIPEDAAPDADEDCIMNDHYCDKIMKMCPRGFHGLSSVNSDESLVSLTGVTFAIFTLITKLLPDEKTMKTDKKEKLLLTLVKLKTGLSFPALGVLFNLHQSSVKRIFLLYLQRLKVLLKDFVYWPNKAIVEATLPKAFHRNYSQTRIVIDCIEVNTEIPQRMIQTRLTYLEYKQRHLMNFMVGCTPSGFVSFVSKCYRGSPPINCGIVDLIEAGEVVLADKEFPQIKSEIEKKNAIFLLPLCHNNKIAIEKSDESYNIALQFEQINQRIKQFNILSKFPASLFPHIDDIVFVICALLNIENPIKNK